MTNSTKPKTLAHGSGIIYLASPLTDTSEFGGEIMAQRTQAAATATALLMHTDGHKHSFFSPVVHGTSIAQVSEDISGFVNIPGLSLGDETHDWWMEQCLRILDVSCALYVLAIEGWTESKGVQMEIKRAQELGIPIFISPNGLSWVEYQHKA